VKHLLLWWMKSIGFGSALCLVLLAQNLLGAAKGFTPPAAVENTDVDEVVPDFAQRVAYAAATSDLATSDAEPASACCETAPCCENACGNCGCNSCGGCCDQGCGGCCRTPLFSTPGCRQPIFSRDKFLGLFRESDHSFDGFVSPATNVLLFEDPRTLSEVRAHFVNQQLGSNAVTPAGGNAQLVAAQIRAAITDRLSFIAVSDGYLWINPKGAPNRSGMNNWVAGLKYNIVRNPVRQFVWSAAATVYIPSNEPQVFMFPTSQLHFFTTAGKKLDFLPFNSHILAGAGIRVPTSSGFTTMAWTSLQFDAEVINHVYGIFGFNGFYYLNNGTNLPIGFEGADLFNLGSAAQGATQAYLSVGTRYKPNGNREYGVAYEFPVTSQQGIMANRLYVDAIFRF
jgi:hypothetical protein